MIYTLLAIFSIANLVYINTIGKELMSDYVRGFNSGANVILIAVNVIKILFP